jgi:hypothetical protein
MCIALAPDLVEIRAFTVLLLLQLCRISAAVAQASVRTMLYLPCSFSA